MSQKNRNFYFNKNKRFKFFVFWFYRKMQTLEDYTNKNFKNRTKFLFFR